MCRVDPILTILVNPLLFTNRDVQTRITIAKISLTCTLERNTARHTPGLDWPLNKDNSQQNLCIRRSRTCHILNRITTPFHNFHRSGVLMSPVARDVSESLRRTISLQGSFTAISWEECVEYQRMSNCKLFIFFSIENQTWWDPSQGQVWSRREVVRIGGWPRSCTL